MIISCRNIRLILATGIGSMVISGCAVDALKAAQDKARDSAVRSNVYTVQIALEQYAVDHNGTYPPEINSQFKCYFPGGDLEKGKIEGRAPTNPFTNKPEWPTRGDIIDLQKARSASPPLLSPGEIRYNAFKDNTCYAIIAGGKDGRAISTSDGKVLVVSPTKADE